MAKIDSNRNQVMVKICFYGANPAAAFRNLQIASASIPERTRSALTQLGGSGSHLWTLSFTPLLKPGVKAERELALHLYALDAPIDEEGLGLLMTGTDVLVFVAEVDPARQAATLQAWRQADAALNAKGADPQAVIIQGVGESTPTAEELAALRSALGLHPGDTVTAARLDGTEMVQTVKAAAQKARSLLG